MRNQNYLFAVIEVAAQVVIKSFLHGVGWGDRSSRSSEMRKKRLKTSLQVALFTLGTGIAVAAPPPGKGGGPGGGGALYTATFSVDAVGDMTLTDVSKQNEVRLEGFGSICFLLGDNIIGNGVGDIGDVLMAVNTLDWDGNGVEGDVFAPSALWDVDGDGQDDAICLDGFVSVFVSTWINPDTGTTESANFRLDWQGADGFTYRIWVGVHKAGLMDNWWVCPDVPSFPNGASLLLGADFAAGEYNCITPQFSGTHFKIVRLNKPKQTVVWPWFGGGATGSIQIDTQAQ